MYPVKTNSALLLVKIKGFMTIKVPIVSDCYVSNIGLTPSTNFNCFHSILLGIEFPVCPIKAVRNTM